MPSPFKHRRFGRNLARCRAVLLSASTAALCLLILLLFAVQGLPPAAHGASRYGAPLRFEAPPVDLEHNTDGAAPAEEEPAGRTPEEATTPTAPAPAASAPAARAPAATAPATPAAVASGTEPSSGSKPIRLFGTVEFRSPLQNNVPKWERVRNAEIKIPTFGGDEKSRMTPDVAARWEALRQKLRDASDMDMIKGVNSFFNQWPYKADTVVWGIEDYWATPSEFIKKSGDCEDYAIAKYYALRNLGMPAAQLRVIAVKDAIRNIGHAVLVVFMDGDAYILDNLTNLVLSHKRLTNYAPQFSVNEAFLWRHIKPLSGPK